MSEETAQEWCASVAYFWREKGDPTRYCYWSEERCAEDWPEFLMMWKEYENARKVLHALAEQRARP